MMVAVIRDDTFEEDTMVVCAQTEQQLYRGVVAYLAACRPLIPATGERLVAPDVFGPGGYRAWIEEVLHDVEDISVEFYFNAMVSQVFAAWCSTNRAALLSQHKPLIQTIKTDLI